MKLYPIIDWDFLNTNFISLKSIANTISHCGFFQLRVKNLHLEKIKEIINICKEEFKNVKIIINDYIDLLSFSEGIHLGIEDLELIKNKNPNFKNKLLQDYTFSLSIEEWKKNHTYILGISTHNYEQFIYIYNQYKDISGYLAIGPCFYTNSKKSIYPVLDKREIKKILDFYIENNMQQSLVFIGGINPSNVKEMWEIYKHYNLKDKFYIASISSFMTGKIGHEILFT